MTTDRHGELSIDGDRATMTFRRRLPHPIEAVWAALTEPVERKAWFGETTIDARTGGTIEMMPDEPPAAPDAKRLTGRSGLGPAARPRTRMETAHRRGQRRPLRTHRGRRRHPPHLHPHRPLPHQRPRLPARHPRLPGPPGRPPLQHHPPHLVHPLRRTSVQLPGLDLSALPGPGHALSRVRPDLPHTGGPARPRLISPYCRTAIPLGVQPAHHKPCRDRRIPLSTGQIR